jgi:hypothetical protein
MTNNKKYQITVIKHLLKNNQIAKSGDVVLGSKFINLQQSLDGGYCKEFIEEDSKKNKKAKKEAKKAAKEQEAKEQEAKEQEAKEQEAKEQEAKEQEAKEQEGVDLNELDKNGLISFAKENDFKLTKKIIAAGKEAIIDSIVKQSE